jgi:hypothetical protein
MKDDWGWNPLIGRSDVCDYCVNLLTLPNTEVTQRRLRQKNHQELQFYNYRHPSLYAISLYAFSLLSNLRKKKKKKKAVIKLYSTILQSPCTVVAWLCGARTSWSHLTSISVRESVELGSPVDVVRSSFIFKAMGKRSRPNCDKNGCKCKKQRKAVALEEKLSVIHFTRFGVTRWFLGTN